MGTEAVWVPLVIGGVTAAAGTAVAVEQARQQNEAIEKSMNSARKGQAIEAAQVSKAAALGQQKNRIKAQQTVGRLRALAADSGLAEDGSFRSLIQQVDFDAAMNSKIIEQNRMDQLARVSSGLQADLTALVGRISNPILAGFGGGLSGAQTGMAIGGAVNYGTAPAVETVQAPIYTGPSPSAMTGNIGTRYA